MVVVSGNSKYPLLQDTLGLERNLNLQNVRLRIKSIRCGWGEGLGIVLCMPSWLLLSKLTECFVQSEMRCLGLVGLGWVTYLLIWAWIRLFRLFTLHLWCLIMSLTWCWMLHVGWPNIWSAQEPEIISHVMRHTAAWYVWYICLINWHGYGLGNRHSAYVSRKNCSEKKRQSMNRTHRSDLPVTWSTHRRTTTGLRVHVLTSQLGNICIVFRMTLQT